EEVARPHLARRVPHRLEVVEGSLVALDGLLREILYDVERAEVLERYTHKVVVLRLARRRESLLVHRLGRVVLPLRQHDTGKPELPGGGVAKVADGLVDVDPQL